MERSIKSELVIALKALVQFCLEQGMSPSEPKIVQAQKAVRRAEWKENQEG